MFQTTNQYIYIYKYVRKFPLKVFINRGTPKAGWLIPRWVLLSGPPKYHVAKGTGATTDVYPFIDTYVYIYNYYIYIYMNIYIYEYIYS